MLTIGPGVGCVAGQLAKMSSMTLALPILSSRWVEATERAICLVWNFAALVDNDVLFSEMLHVVIILGELTHLEVEANADPASWWCWRWRRRRR